jgi:hypothetical protein
MGRSTYVCNPPVSVPTLTKNVANSKAVKRARPARADEKYFVEDIFIGIMVEK